jgi:formylglycine-generating enzyme required for sulfatase activity
MQTVSRVLRSLRVSTAGIGIGLISVASVTVAQEFTHARIGFPCHGNGPKDEMVRVGPICVDKYEASVWSEPGGHGVQYPQSDPRYPATFPVNGNWTEPLYAASVKGVAPAVFITWFQAQQACALAGKRLLTNAEWQMAAAGTPDPGVNGDGINTCNTNTPGPLPTGSSVNCVSKWGVYDMVGNVGEWVADWMHGPGTAASDGHYVTGEWNPKANNSQTTSSVYGNDYVGFVNGAVHAEAPQTGPNSANNDPDAFPSAISRGGFWLAKDGAGVFMFEVDHTPSSLDNATGFRCAK